MTQVHKICEHTFDQNIWQSSATLETKLHLYNTCIPPIFYVQCSDIVNNCYLIKEDWHLGYLVS